MSSLAVSPGVLAADYYFDSVGGNDSADGKTEATAKQTLKMPTGTGNVVHLRRGSSWTMSLSASNVTVTTYGTGERPIINGGVTVSNSVVEGLKILNLTGNGMNVQSGSTVQDNDIDGTNCTSNGVAMGVMGTGNKIYNNILQHYHNSQSGGQMDNSGGAEGVMVMASNNEIAWNSAYDLMSPNSTLGGFEGGCYEIVNGKAKSTISNVSFHHNYCEKSIGMWEASSGDFSASGGAIQDPANHGIVENVTISYNLSVDAMWMFLLQPVNTDFKNLVFANNTIIHTPNTMVWFDASHTSMGLDVHTYTNTAAGDGGTSFDTDTPYYKKGAGFQPGTVIVKNNIFVDNISPTKQYMMFSTSLTDHFNNIFVPAKAQVGSLTLGSTEQKLDLAALAFTSDYRLTSASTPAIDKGVTVDMTTNGSVATSAIDPTIFTTTFNQDIDKHQVPCGAAVDIGASEYCEGAGGSSGLGDGGSSGAGGAAGAGGATTPAGTGGAKASGGATGATGAGGATTPAGTGGAKASGGATGAGGTQGAGGVQGAGGAKASGGVQGAGGTPGAGGLQGSGGAQDLGGAPGAGGTSGGTTNVGTGAGNKGCSCALGRSNGGGAGATALALLLFVLARRRRRRACGPSRHKRCYRSGLDTPTAATIGLPPRRRSGPRVGLGYPWESTSLIRALRF
jgi:hypothetical protein